MKQYLGISRDHSRSMYSLASGAMKDYNDTIISIQDAANANKIDTIVSVVKNGVGWDAKVERDVVNSNVQVLNPLRSYETDGSGTPLFDSVGELITIMKSVPDYNDSKVSFLIMVITDGQENHSKKWKNTLANEIKTLQATDRWTFVFRVPKGYGRYLSNLGIPSGNVLEWEQTMTGLQTSTAVTKSAVSSYYTMRSSGATSSSTFYADLSSVTPQQVKTALVDISNKIQHDLVVRDNENGMQIRDFVINRGYQYVIGTAFYQLSKTEDIQETKNIIVQKKGDSTYYGDQARNLIGLSQYGTTHVNPYKLGDYNVFVQSTSVNRKVVKGTRILIVK